MDGAFICGFCEHLCMDERVQLKFVYIRTCACHVSESFLGNRKHAIFTTFTQ